jgi:hypothetical protein
MVDPTTKIDAQMLAGRPFLASRVDPSADLVPPAA